LIGASWSIGCIPIPLIHRRARINRRNGPASRFWHFQLIEGGWLLALAVLLVAAAVMLVRNRAA
jgi:hypothetical protein